MPNNIYVKEYKIKLGEKDHKLRFDLGAFGALEEEGYEYMKIVEMATNLSFKTIPILVWAGIQHEENDLTIKQITQMMDLQSVVQIGPVLGNAILNTVPQEEATDEREEAPGKKQQEKNDPA